MRLVDSGEDKCPLVYGNGEIRFKFRGRFSFSVGSYVSAYIWKRKGEVGTENEFGSFPLGPFNI
jgi:hypothetical protein